MATKKQTQQEVSNPNTQLEKKEPTHSERFLTAVQREFEGSSGEPIQLSNFQRKLIKNYFIKIDLQLKQFQQKNLMKSENKRELDYDWKNLNLQKLALDVITYSSVGLDPLQPNHINFIPYKNNSTGKYDLTPIMGYRGIELKAKKYGLDVPDEVVIELVYEKDKFIPVKKDMKNKIESYVFEQSSEFDRGDIVGGFYYFNYFEQPQKNRLKTFSIADIEKRKPRYASVEFWGGEKDVWKNGQPTGEKETVDGWYEEMCWKTIARAAYNSITIDSEKIDENFVAIATREQEARDEVVMKEIDENANRKEIGFGDSENNGNGNGNSNGNSNGNGNVNYHFNNDGGNVRAESTSAATRPATRPAPKAEPAISDIAAEECPI